MRDEAAIPPLDTPDFLSLWDTLANAKTGPDLSVAWERILERAAEIAPRALNELWEFTLDEGEKMPQQMIRNSTLAAILGIGLLAGCSTNPVPASLSKNPGPAGPLKSAVTSNGLGMGGSTERWGSNVTQRSTSDGKIYQIHITIKSPSLSHPWRSFFEASFNKKTSFESVGILSPREWYGIRGWVKVERDGLHYKILIKDIGKPARIVLGEVTGNQQEYCVSLNDKK